MYAARFRSFAGSFLVLAILFASGNASPAAAQTRRSFRVSTLTITDPPIFVFSLNGCNAPVNSIINSAINVQFLNVCEPVTVGVPEPCTFDLNLVAVFDPLVQTAGPPPDLVPCMSDGLPCELDFAGISSCTRSRGTSGPGTPTPTPVITCDGEPSFVFPTTYSNGGFAASPTPVGVTCLEGVAGTFGANNLGINPKPTPAVANATGNCAVTGEFDLNLEVGDGLLNIPLKGARLGARFVNDPATGLTSGLARGFLSEAAAEAIRIDIDTPIAIHGTLASLLAGGNGNCKTAPPAPTPAQDDRDYNPPGDMNGERGWWFHLGFAATQVNVPEFPTPTATASIPVDNTPTPTPSPIPTNTPAFTFTNTAVPPTSTNTPVPTDTPSPVPTDTPSNTPVPTGTAAVAPCGGDCDGNREVDIAELQRIANIFLETQDLSLCPVADADHNGEVAINEVQLAANSFQFDCPQ